MSVRRAPYNIHTAACAEAINDLRGLVSLLERGKISGVVYGAWAPGGQHVYGLSGCLRANTKNAYWLAGRLMDQVLYYDDPD